MQDAQSTSTSDPLAVDMVNHPPHYTRGPKILLKRGVGTSGDGGSWLRRTLHVNEGGRLYLMVECIDVIRHIRDPRLFTAMKYIWRVGFGGKANDREDINKAIFYLNDWLENPVDDGHE